METDKPTMELIRDWLSGLDVQRISKVSYRRKIQYWFRWLSANNRDVCRPRKVDVIAYKQALTADGKTELTVAGYVRIVKLFYKWTSIRNIYPNIAIEVHCHVSTFGHRKAALSVEQAAQLLTSIDITTHRGLRDRLAITMMLHLGLRTVELERMNIGDISTIDGTPIVYIQRKGRREKREALQLTPDISNLIVAYIGDKAFDDADPLFTSESRHWSAEPKRLCRSDLTKIVKKRLRNIGIDRKDITTHSLRHTCASLLLKNGTDIETIRDLLGHSSTDTTRIYVNDIIQENLLHRSPSIDVQNLIQNAIINQNNTEKNK